MALLGNDFVREPLEKPARCSECGKRMAKGALALVSRRSGRVQKRVCGEDCRLTFDAAYWEAKAQERRGNRAWEADD